MSSVSEVSANLSALELSLNPGIAAEIRALAREAFNVNWPSPPVDFKHSVAVKSITVT